MNGRPLHEWTPDDFLDLGRERGAVHFEPPPLRPRGDLARALLLKPLVEPRSLDFLRLHTRLRVVDDGTHLEGDAAFDILRSIARSSAEEKVGAGRVSSPCSRE